MRSRKRADRGKSKDNKQCDRREGGGQIPVGKIERDEITQEILDRLKLTRENITDLLDIEVEPEETLRRELEAKAQIRSVNLKEKT